MSNSQYIYVYQTICEANGKSYVGVHSTNNMDDGYIGCGVYSQSDATMSKRNLLFHKAVKKHGYHLFKKYILSFYDTYQEALDEEKFIVNESWVISKDNYNTAFGGRGNTTGWMDDDKKEKWKLKIKNGVKDWMSNGGYEILVKNAKKPRINPKQRKRGYSSPNRWREVVQYELNGDFVKIYPSGKQAAKEVGTTPGNIVSSCKGDYKTCKGYYFRYRHYSKEEALLLQEKLSKFVERKPNNSKCVLAYKLNGDFVGEYISIAEAARRLNITNNYVSKNLIGMVKQCKGYYFKYKK